MKPINIYPAKVAITSALMMALGYQASIKISQYSRGNAGGSTEMASSAPVTGEITDKANRKAVVAYMKNGDKTMAIIPVMDAEGKICETCGNDSVLLDVNFDQNRSDIEALNKALAAKLGTQSAPGGLIQPPAKPVVEAPKPVLSKDAKDLAALEKKIKNSCGSTSGSSDVNQCLVDTFLSELSFKRVSHDVAMFVFTRHIEGRFIAQLADTNFEDGSSRTNSENARYLYDKLLSNIPAEYNGVRERVVFSGANGVLRAAMNYQELLGRAQREPNNPDLKSQSIMAQSRLQDLERNLTVMSNPDTGRSLYNAVKTNDILLKDARMVYQQNYETPVKAIMTAAMKWNPITVLPNGRPSDVINLNSASLPPSLAYPNLFKVSSATGSATIDLPVQTTTQVDLPATTIDGASASIPSPLAGPATTIGGTTAPGMPSASSSGITFGDQKPISREQLEERAKLRNGNFRMQ